MKRQIRIAEYGFAFLALFFLTGGTTNLFTAPGSTEAPMVQLLGILIGVISAGLLALNPKHANKALRLYWPVLMLPAFALFSLLWSADPTLTIRRSGSLILTTIFALWLVTRFDQRDIFKLVVAAMIALCIFCWYFILLQPKIGIHQADDPFTETLERHAGAWRGAFNHKNDFGRAIALSAVVFAIAFAFFRRWRWAFALGFLQSMLMIAFSSSSQSIILSIFPTIAFVMVFWLRNKPARFRTIVIAQMIPVAVIAYFAADILFSTLLNALGKDSTLTGRTEIWAGVIDAMYGHFLVGGGFGAGWALVGDHLIANANIFVGHAHNGYLDLVTDIGLLGTGLVLGFAVVIGVLAFRAMFTAPDWVFGAMTFAYIVYYIVGNWAGSFLMLHNSIYWVMLISGFCVLRNLFNPYAQRARSKPPMPLSGSRSHGFGGASGASQ